MKKVVTFFTVLAMTLCIAVSAYANVYEQGGDYVIKFRGFEYAYFGSHADFMKGDAGLVDKPHDAEGNLASGFSMTAVLWTTAVYTTSAPGYEPADPYPIYQVGETAGVYLSVLRDLYAETAEGNVNDANKGVITFTGGYLDWYYIPYEDASSLTVADLSGATWKEGEGLVLANGVSLGDYLENLDPIVTFELAGNNGHTGVAQVYINEGGQIEANATFHANVTDPDSIFNSDAYGGFDLSFQADLKWWDTTGRFSVDDPAYVSTPAPTPEPSSLLLMSMGLLVTGYVVRRNRKP